MAARKQPSSQSKDPSPIVASQASSQTGDEPPTAAAERCQSLAASIKGKPGRVRAMAFLRLTADSADQDPGWDKTEYIRYEAQVYLASRGMLGDADRRVMRRNWDAAVEYEQQCFAQSNPKEGLPTPSSLSPQNLDYFWDTEIVLSQTVTTPTMLRAASLCEIHGFDPWWQRVAFETRANALQEGAGFDGIEGSWWCFCMARSDYAIELLGDTLLLIFEQCLQRRHVVDHYPWEVVSGSADNPIKKIHADICAELLFVAERLNAKTWVPELRLHAWRALYETFNSNGYWENQVGPSVRMTAIAIHALALGRPTGWKNLVKPAIRWLWSQQNEDGWWGGKTYPGHAFVTVLVLDAIDLAEGKFPLTFDLSQSEDQLKGAEGENRKPPTSKSREEGQIEWLTKALLLVQRHPDWSDAEIARNVGKSPSTLSRNETYKLAAKISRGEKQDFRTGFKTRDSFGGLSDVVSIDDPDDPDWGQDGSAEIDIDL